MAEQTEKESVWLSTYGLVTIERILGYYQMKLSQEDLICALNNQDGFFYKLVQLPLINVLTGLVRQQAYDYQVYAQKLYVDYLLSGETVKPESSPGGLTREELETTRLDLVATSKSFHELEYAHNKQISTSQRLIVQALKPWLKELSGTTKKIQSLAGKHQVKWSTDQIEALILTLFANLSLETVDQDPKQVQSYIEIPEAKVDVEEVMASFCENLTPLKEQAISLIEKTQALEDEAQSIQQQMRQFRGKFEQLIITSTELLSALPDYTIDPEQDLINRELIQMDNQVTDSSSEQD